MTILERNALIEAYLPLANKIAFEKKKCLPRRVDLDDLKSAAYFGLVDAATKFDPARSTSFGTYAKFRIMGEIADFIRESCRDNERCPVSLDTPDESGSCMAACIPQGEPCKDFKEIFDDATKTLTNIDKNIMVMYYLDDLSMKEIGVKIGVSESRVSQILKRSKDKVQMTVAA